jgi:hypothetical protein
MNHLIRLDPHTPQRVLACRPACGATASGDQQTGTHPRRLSTAPALDVRRGMAGDGFHALHDGQVVEMLRARLVGWTKKNTRLGSRVPLSIDKRYGFHQFRDRWAIGAASKSDTHSNNNNKKTH